MRPWVDTSRHNGKLDVKKIKARGFVGIIARCTIGVAPVDEQYYRTQEICAGEGMKFAAYGVNWPANRNPRLEARYFVDHLGSPMPEFVVGDFEVGLKDKTLSGANLVDQAIKWMDMVGSLVTVPSLFYTAMWYWNSKKLGPFTNRGELRWKVLPAHYPYDPRQIPGFAPRYSKDVLSPYEIGSVKPLIPYPWNKAAKAAGWQWTSKGRGAVDGYQESRFMDRIILFD